MVALGGDLLGRLCRRLIGALCAHGPREAFEKHNQAMKRARNWDRPRLGMQTRKLPVSFCHDLSADLAMSKA